MQGWGAVYFGTCLAQKYHGYSISAKSYECYPHLTMVKPGSDLCGLSPQVFCLIPFFFSEIRLFFKKPFKYFARVLQSYITQPALQNLYSDFNSIWRYSLLIYQNVCVYTKKKKNIALPFIFKIAPWEPL